MRSVLSISISPVAVRRIKKRAKARGMTVSAYLVKIIDMDDTEEHTTTEDEMLAFAKEAERDVRSGKAKKLKKPTDLLLPELP